MDFDTIKGTKHYVYHTEKEYRDYFDGLNQRAPELHWDWREAPEGAWVVADDGGIVQILKADVMGRRQTRYCRTVVGSFVCNESVEMDTDFEAHPDRYRFSKKDMSHRDRVKARKNCTVQEIRFVQELLKGELVEDAYKKAFRNPDMEYYKAKSKGNLLIKQERIMSEFKKEIKKVAGDLGIDAEYVLSNYKHMVDNLTDPELAPTRKTALDSLARILGAFDKESEGDKDPVGFRGFNVDEIDEAVVSEEKQALPEKKEDEFIEVEGEIDKQKQEFETVFE